MSERPAYPRPSPICKRRPSAQVVVACAIAMASFSCTKSPSPASPEIVNGLPAELLILRHKGGEIRAKDVQRQVQPELERFKDEAITAYRKAAETEVLKDFANKRAKAAGYADAEDYIRRKRPTDVPTDTALRAFMERNQLPASSLDSARKFMIEQASVARAAEIQAMAADEAQISWSLTRPRREIAYRNPKTTKGPQSPRHFLDLFCDFSDTRCSAARIEAIQTWTRHSQDTQLTFHPLARENSEASQAFAQLLLCEAGFDAFWKFMDAPDANPARSTGNCRNPNRPAPELRREADVARALGVTEGPAIFADGIRQLTWREAESSLR